jgi:UMP-CMP kinase
MEENYPVVHLSVGQLLRDEQTKEDSPHREMIEQSLVAGQIVPVEISLQLVQEAMKEAAAINGKQLTFLIDGFPRNYDNLTGWAKAMPGTAAIGAVLVYKCPLKVLEERILERAKTSGRSDDNLASVQERFTTFERDTIPVITSLRQAAALSDQWSVVDVRGDQPLETVWVASQQVLNELILHDVLTANAALLRAVETGDVAQYESVCDAEWFVGNTDPASVMSQQEGEPAAIGEVCRAQLDFISGKHVAVSYDRVMQGEVIREKRIWSHQGQAGWRNVHFARTPIV